MNYKAISIESLEKISNCFSGTDEVVSFIRDLDQVVEEIHICRLRRDRTEPTAASHIVLAQICYVTLFYRENIELIQHFLKNI